MNKEVVNVSLCFKLLGDVCSGPFRLDWIGPSSTSDLGFVKQIMDLPQIRCSYWRGNKDMLKKLDRNGSIGSYCKIYGSRFTPHSPLPLKALLYWHIALGVNFCKDFDSTFVFKDVSLTVWHCFCFQKIYISLKPYYSPSWKHNQTVLHICYSFCWELFSSRFFKVFKTPFILCRSIQAVTFPI